MTMPALLTIVTVAVEDLARSEAFYARLGWRRCVSSVPGNIAWFDLGGVYLGLYGAHALAVDAGFDRDGAAGGFRGVTLAVNVATDDEVDAAFAAAVAAGARATVEPVTTDYGVRHACFADPDGHVWEVAHAGFPGEGDRMVIP